MSPEPVTRLLLPGGELELGRRTLVMGVVNVTPDSFSDGGRFLESEQAVEQALALLAQGADILDIGGESTRPGARAVPLAEELERVLPVIRGIRRRRPRALISIDTYKAPVARAALEAGAVMVNDVTALAGDPDMAALVAETGAALVLMHMKGTPRTMQEEPYYQDVVAEVTEFLARRLERARAAGIEAQRIMLDPGIGFGKTLEHNLLLIRHLGELRRLGRPILLGASRKAFIGLITGRPVSERLWGTIGAHVAGAVLGADMVRVHDVGPVREALLVSDAVMRAGEQR